MLIRFTATIILILSFHVYAQDKAPIKDKACGLNEKSRKLAQLIINDPKQNRKRLVCDSLLSEIAEKKAMEMATRQRVKHNASNRRLIDAGYPLSKIYPRLFENNVEAIAGGISDAKAMWKNFKQSEGHRMHLLAEHEFYLLQDEIGVGYFNDPDTPHVDYWVVYVAHRKEQQKYQGEIAESKD